MSEFPRTQLAAYAAAGVLVVVAATRLLGGGGGEAERPAVRLDAGGGGATAGGSDGQSPGARIYVHVAGAVRRPGLYRVAARSRVAVAIERAGGPSPKAELSAVNLAALLEDGQQVVVPRRGAVASSSSEPAGAAGATRTGGGPAGAGGAALISLATATVEQLDGLDGIGPTLAKRIIAHRDERGGFRSVAGLREVEGIGPKRYESLKQSVRP